MCSVQEEVFNNQELSKKCLPVILSVVFNMTLVAKKSGVTVVGVSGFKLISSKSPHEQNAKDINKVENIFFIFYLYLNQY